MISNLDSVTLPDIEEKAKTLPVDFSDSLDRNIFIIFASLTKALFYYQGEGEE
jgi:hypothetical protein